VQDSGNNCAQRLDQLKGCDPNVPGFMDFKQLLKGKQGRLMKNLGGALGFAGRSGKLNKKGKKRRSTTPAA
jgi:hypothetical protein